MRFVKKILRAGLLVLLVLAAAAAWKREDVTRLIAVNSLFAEDRIVQNFSNMDVLFLHRELPRGDGEGQARKHGVQGDANGARSIWPWTPPHPTSARSSSPPAGKATAPSCQTC